MIEDIIRLTGATHFYNGFANVVHSTPPGMILIDIDPHTKEFICINDSSKVRWIFEIHDKSNGYLHT